jgi:Uma2 family endonuclease
VRAVAERIYSESEYLLLEETAQQKHEFYNGNIIKMPGASYTHNLIAANMITALNNALEKTGKSYFVCTGDMKIRIPRLKSFVYPDAVVICEEPGFYNGRTDVILNPLLVAEVLSSSTGDYDRYGKFHEYKTLASFREYVLVEQTQPWVTASFKTADRTWIDTEAEGAGATIFLRSIDCIISLDKIYRGVKFE